MVACAISALVFGAAQAAMPNPAVEKFDWQLHDLEIAFAQSSGRYTPSHFSDRAADASAFCSPRSHRRQRGTDR
jgi:hypothetical protein